MAKERKGKKLRRCAKKANYYKLGFGRTEDNRKRRMREHIRSHPEDAQAVNQYEYLHSFGPASTFGLNSKGRKRKRASQRRERRAP